MQVVLLVLAAVLSGVLWHLGRAAVGVFQDIAGSIRGMQVALEDLAEGPEAAFSLRLAELEDTVERLPKKWEDIKREAGAAEQRARHHVRRAREELEERGFTDPGVEQLAGELQLLDGGGSDPEGVQPVHQEVEGPQAQPQSWRQIANARKYGG